MMGIIIFLTSSRAQLFSPQFQNAFEIETWWAILITAGLLLLGALIGLLISWYVTGRDQKRAKSEVEQLRIARDTAQSARAQAMNERERAMRELQGKQQEYALVESQLRTTQKQLDQAQAALHVSDQQSEELTASARALRLQVDELRKRLAESEQVSSERHMALAQVSSDLNETQARFNETQRVAAERQATLVSVNAQLSEYRARIAEADISTAEMQATLLSLGSQIEAHRMRLAEIERRAQAPREALVPSSAKSMAAAKEAISIPKPRSIPTPLPTTPAVTPVEPPKASEAMRSAVMPEPASNGGEHSTEGEDDQIVELQDQVATLMERLQTLRENGTPAPLQKAADAKQSLLIAEPPEPVSDDASEAPDGVLTLENIKGIGVGYAARLRASGITNVRDLANSTRAQLETIIKAPKWRQPDYEDWIRTARLMVRNGAL
jgi:predicted flap endonuclease-1-like 5' DNA nuclease